MSNMLWIWIVCLAMYLFLVGTLGLATSAGRWWGILVDERNKFSLSRLQLVLWTTLVVPLLVAIGLKNMSMNIVLPDEILALLGISVGSTAGALMIKGNKAATEPDTTKLKETLDDVPRMGVLQVNTEPKGSASFLDIFMGEEITDYKYVDISKLQLFLFTIASWVGYGFVLWTWPFAPLPRTDSAGKVVDQTEQLFQFPGLSATLVTLIGISHVGYLTMKATRKTPVQ